MRPITSARATLTSGRRALINIHRPQGYLYLSAFAIGFYPAAGWSDGGEGSISTNREGNAEANTVGAHRGGRPCTEPHLVLARW